MCTVENTYLDSQDLVGFYKHTTHQGNQRNEDPKYNTEISNYAVYMHERTLVVTNLLMILSSSLSPNFDMIKLQYF